jgi:hypothetical protein
MHTPIEMRNAERRARKVSHSAFSAPRSPFPLPASAFRVGLAFILLLGASAGPDAVGQGFLEIRQEPIRYNLSSTNGLPISTIRGIPPGSDGRGPTLAQQQAANLTEVPATANQFQGFAFFGAVARPGNTNLNPALSLGANTERLDLPRIKVNGAVVMSMPRARITPILGRAVSFLFGEVIPRPDKDEYGVLLSTVNTGVTPNRPVASPETYWLPEPYSTANHTNGGYYWSPHAQKVFAVNPGPLTVAWRRNVASTAAAPPAGVANVLILGVSYVVATNQYVVSGSPIKTPRQMYWTERSFVDTGKPVTVPSARVGAVNVVYNNIFPERVANEVVIPGAAPIVTSNTLQEVRTLWYDDTGGQVGGQIRAYNAEGRVFVELLGDVRGPNARQHLGFEIVDVIRQPAANDVTIELGEKLTAYPDNTPGDDALFPEPLLLVGQTFTFRHTPGGSTRPNFYANRETQNQNDLQVHWLEEGLEGLKWPFRLARYKLVWPDDVAKYSHYVRPLAMSESEAKATAVPLPSQNAPTIDYQDPLDQPRGKLTENFAYYSFLTTDYPAHRALLRFTSGEFIRFERVFSWLDQGLRDRNAPPSALANNDLALNEAALENSVATNLTWVVGNPGFAVRNIRGTVAPCDLTVANSVLASPALQASVSAENAPVVNYLSSGGSGNFAADARFPGMSIGTDDDFFVTEAIGSILIPASGLWTFGVNSDDGFRCEIGTNSFEFAAPRPALDTFATFNLAAGRHPVRLVFFECNGGAALEFFAAAGSYTNFNASFRLVGDTVAGGLAVRSAVPVPIASRPRVVNTTIFVGERIVAPMGEIGNALETNYLAGYIRQSEGDLFHPGAYVDPFAGGFEAANRSAIIPVNSMPGKDRLEVWWFRKNAANAAQGFGNTLWPAVIGRYAIQYPTSPAEIVLASNDGSGPLLSLQANGNIYYQNDPSLPGYNPNEEHALVQGGQAFALRDDLNITTATDFTSRPFVLLSYTESDGRPALRPFKVLREKPEVGITFNYEKDAGTILQPPMPLPLLEKPLAPNLAGQPPKSLNTEIDAYEVAATLQVGNATSTNYGVTLTSQHFIRQYDPVALQDPSAPGAPYWLLPTSLGTSTILGPLSQVRPLELTPWTGAQSTLSNRWRFSANVPSGVPINFPGWIYDTVAKTSWSVQLWVADPAAGYIEVQIRFDATVPEAAKSANLLALTVAGFDSSVLVGHRLATEPLPTTIADASLRDFYGRFTLQDRKGNTWFYRGPHVLTDSPSLVMQFYYKTLPGFFFPTLPLSQQPPVGTVTPYLRPLNAQGAFVGEPVYGNVEDSNQDADGNALGITYRPVWPQNVPVLQMAETLTTPKRGLPAARGQTSLEILYQQSQTVGGDMHESALLHDPTREKSFTLGPPENQDTLDSIPPSVKTSFYQGKTYFPNLPPHLAERFWFDPNRGEFGELVFKGQFVDAALGEKYVFLNVIGQGDFGELTSLCDTNDQKKAFWDAAIVGLATALETFIENPAQPRTYIPSDPEVIGAGEISRIKNDDVAVDSYALTATGPGTGYISLIAGNGRAFTPEGEPVSVEIVKVVNTLYRGEVNIVQSSNPLNEKLTLQQVIDLAAKIEDYEFEWKIASPVDGLPPVVYQNTPRTLLADGAWSHLRFLLPTDKASAVAASAATRLSVDASTAASPVSRISYTSLDLVDGKFRFNVAASSDHGLVAGNQVVVRTTAGTEIFGTVHAFTTSTNIYVSQDPNQNVTVAANEILELNERVMTNGVQSIVFRQFEEPAGNYSQYWLSLDLDDALGAVVYLDGQLVVRANTGQNDSATTSPPGGLFPLKRIFRLSAADLAGGTLNPNGSRTHTIAVELISSAFPGQYIAFNARLEAFTSVDRTEEQWLPLGAASHPDGVRAVIGGTADVRSLADNYLIMRYQPINSAHASFGAWSQWTTPQLAEGWIKRVLAGINPFNQRITDLFNNSVNTDVSIVAQAGQRWEGDVALNLDAVNNAGLIEIYETVLGRGKMLSIGGGINYGPANDALLLAAGYLNDLYMVLGNEAWADASNPTIGIGTKDNTYGAVATALFSFKGQLPTVLEEELALMRGRDDFLLPGVELRPVYNRMIWNYTRGIDAGEVIYALNYNVLDQNTDGVVNAEDARRLYPQGHGDAYGHYLTALKGYYALLLNDNFDWVPRIEAVTVLGKPVSVDYQDERKFATAAGALARAGKQTFDLTWRRDYLSGKANGWSHFAATKPNSTTRSIPTTRYWGADHWASRTGQGAFLNWVVGNAILPDQDPDFSHQGSIQQIDRTTVPELKELVSVSTSLQAAMDNAEAGHTPLGLPSTTVPFDLNPNAVVGTESNTHFEQVYGRAKRALNNAIVSFDDAKDVTRLMRSEEDSLADFRTTVNKQELAYTNTLIELYGTPYPQDIGPGRTYRTGYNGPDTLHYMYVDTKEINFNGLLDPASDASWIIDTQTFRPGWAGQDLISTFGFIEPAFIGEVDGTGRTEDYLANTNLFIQYNLSSHGFFMKPESWTGQRSSPGKIQQAISDIVKARNAAFTAFYWADAAKYDLDWAIGSLDQKKASWARIRGVQGEILRAQVVIDQVRVATETASAAIQLTAENLASTVDIGKEAIPTSFIAGLAVGGDFTSSIRAAIKVAGQVASDVLKALDVVSQSVHRSLALATETANRYLEFNDIAPEQFNQELRDAVSVVRDKVYGMNNNFMTINQRLQELDDAQRKYRSLLAEGDRIQQERQIFRQRAAAVIQGYRTRDAAFRIFRNEKLERYKTLFDLAAQYAYMAAQAYDYETGLLHTDQGKEFINRIVRSRALGVVQGGEPQFAGSDTGDPGLSSAMAEMFADWSVVKGRLGFNNPDAYGTTVSLRTEKFRILPGTNGQDNWKDILNQARKANILDDPDVRRYCLQIDSGNGLPVPGLVLEFSTTIADGMNLFGQSLAAYDHAFSQSSFATKIFAAGVALEGYLGMDDPAANSGAVGGSGGSSPSDPNLSFLDSNALSATPYVYLIPVGVDSMRSPALGDTSQVRNWSVNDVAIPLPFNISGSQFSSAQLYQSSDSLTEEPFAIRKHQAFRPVSSADVFDPSIYAASGGLTRSEWTNNRLIGRSVWNSKWKLIIPGKTLLNNPDEGLERLLRTLNDIKLHFVTYSYSGN